MYEMHPALSLKTGCYIDKFSKWIEVRPLNSIRSEQAVAFFTNIIHRFGVPNSIITDNGTQFTGRKFLYFCEDHHIRVDWAAVAHPMSNGQVERANGMILQGLKPRMWTVEKGHGSRGEMMVTRSAITERQGWRRKGQGGRFPLLWLSLSGCENLRGRQEAEQRTIARPSPEYIKTKARPVQRSARTRRGIQKRKAKQPFPERLAHAQRPPREPLTP
jgi:hypothetical protein